MPQVTDQQVHDAISKILADRKSYSTSLNYAVEYCKVGLSQTGHDLKVQCLYILNNISHWRHLDAKEVRTILKSFSK